MSERSDAIARAERAAERYLATAARYAAQGRAMKTGIAYFVSALVLDYAVFRWALLQGTAPSRGNWVLDNWPVLTGVVTILLVGRGVQISVNYLKAGLAMKADRTELTGAVAVLQASLTGLGNTIEARFDGVCERIDALGTRVARIELHEDGRKSA